jgi:iron complex outermembrane recepter protein
VELDVSAQPVRGLTLSAAAARINARIDSFKCPPDAEASCNVDDKPLPFSPDWKANGRIDYVVSLPTDKSLSFGAVYRWQSDTQYDISQTPDAIQPAYGIFDASIALADGTKGYQVALLARNLSNESYASFIGTVALTCIAGCRATISATSASTCAKTSERDRATHPCQNPRACSR